MSDEKSGQTDRLELAARAAFAAFGHDVAKAMPWEQAPEDFRITFRMVADAVLMVAEPLIREQIAQEFEAMAAPWGGDAHWLTTGTHIANLAAEVVRAGGQR